MCGFYELGGKLNTLAMPHQHVRPPKLWNATPRIPMIDIVYILGTVAFFALMLLYVRACERLGRDTNDTTERTP